MTGAALFPAGGERDDLAGQLHTTLGASSSAEVAAAVQHLAAGASGQAPAPASGAAVVHGTPSSPGVDHGTVRVIRGLDDFSRFTPRDVLVCHTTSPAWTPLLACAAAVVTERGGILSHAAIVAREFGIPAITGAENATTLLAKGQDVVVDGTRGIVTTFTNTAPPGR